MVDVISPLKKGVILVCKQKTKKLYLLYRLIRWKLSRGRANPLGPDSKGRTGALAPEVLVEGRQITK